MNTMKSSLSVVLPSGISGQTRSGNPLIKNNMLKLNVKLEWREDIYLVEKEDIIEYIKKNKQNTIHNMSWRGSLFIWADWEKKSVIENIKGSARCAIVMKWNMWHKLAVVWDKWLEMFQIDIDKENLNITV